MTCPNGIHLADGDVVHKVYVEMKNKHNTMNSASAGKTYIKMQNQLLEDDDCACFLVEAIAKCSQDTKWEASVDGKRVRHKRIRRVSIDQFYAMVTHEEDAFFQLCMVLPEIIALVVDSKDMPIPHDTVMEELQAMALEKQIPMEMAAFLLGFPDYLGFRDYTRR